MEKTKNEVQLAKFEAKVKSLKTELDYIELIKSEVAEYFRLAPASLSKKSRSRTYVWPRQIAIYFTRKFTTFGLLDVARMYGLTNHATALHSVKVVENDISVDKRKLNQINQIKLNLLQHGIEERH
jgi:chromosomal replication initiator protein